MTQKTAIIRTRIYCTFEQWLFYNPKSSLKRFLRWATRLGFKVVDLDVTYVEARSS